MTRVMEGFIHMAIEITKYGDKSGDGLEDTLVLRSSLKMSAFWSSHCGSVVNKYD